jgi:spermidine/putrescine ABC transporter ATP-binding subunit
MQVLIKEITKSYGSLKAIDRVSLSIEGGEFFTLLGPSGCGKTTLLRVIAGFAVPDGGEVYFEKERIDPIPPHKRKTGMVFQNYALFPHMNVFDNVAYGLRARKMGREEIQSRVIEILRNVHLENLAHRFPNQLSGGQQQRVALARALVIQPKVLLMDEPLSNLDAKLRVSMREEIRRIQKRLGITTVYVTHDQEEAMAISDRIAIFNAGQVQQIGTPSEIYFQPKSRFVAEFTGISNLLNITVSGYDRERSLIEAKINGEPLRIKGTEKSPGNDLMILLRPEWIKIARSEADTPINLFRGKVVSSTFTGSMVRYQIEAFRNHLLTIEVQDPHEDDLKKAADPILFWFKADRPVILEY